MEDLEKTVEEWEEQLRDEIGIEAVEKNEVMGMGFQVCSEVRKPLAAVWRICHKGNVVQFGPADEYCYIQNIKSFKKVELRKKGGSYVMDVELVFKGDVVGVSESTIDSGAEEGEMFEVKGVGAEGKMRLVNASGGEGGKCGSTRWPSRVFEWRGSARLVYTERGRSTRGSRGGFFKTV